MTEGEARELKMQGKTIVVYPAKSDDGKMVKHPMSGTVYGVDKNGSHRRLHAKPRMSKKKRRKWREEQFAKERDERDNGRPVKPHRSGGGI